jgi:hypothetical protein
MLYEYTILIPIVIVIIIQRFSNYAFGSFTGIFSLMFRSLPYLYGYGFFLYYLESNQFISTGWSTYSFFFFLVPLSVVVLFLKAYSHFSQKRK